MVPPAITSHSQKHLSDLPVLSVQSGCQIHLLAHYNDNLPAVPHGLCHVTPPPDSPGPSLQPSPPSDASNDSFKSSLVEYQTKPDYMGLFCIYPIQPTFIPDVDCSILTYVEVPTLDTTSTSEHESDHHSALSHPTSEAGLPMDITSKNVFSAFSSPAAALLMCWQYFGLYWKSSDTEEPIRVYREAYSSPTYLDTYYKINSLPCMAGDDLEHIVVPLMLWSNAMQLANFGSGLLWLIYLFLSNQSKYA